jgi:hypothetical protein
MSQLAPAGYRKRPWELTVLGVFFALVPLLSWAAWYAPFFWAGRPESPFQVLASYFATASNGPIGLAHALVLGALWVLFLVVARGILKVDRWGFFLCIVAAVANSLFSTVLYGVGGSGTDLHEFLKFNPVQWGTLLNLIFFVPVIILLRDKIMAPFFNPKLKWWEQHPRIKALLKIDATIAGEKKSYQSFDISASGMFLGTGEKPPLATGDTFPATIYLEETGTAIDVLCKTVWVSDGTGRSPVGCGVTFEYRQRSQKKALPKYIKTKIQEGYLLERK